MLNAFLAAHPYEAPLFPKLVSVEVAADGCATPAVNLSLTTALKSVDIDTGVNTGRKAAGVERSGLMADYLTAANLMSHILETTRIRGFACERLNSSIAQLTSLRVLSLKVGNSLMTDTLVAVAFFPGLEELTVHADRVDPERFNEQIADKQAPVFPSLHTLQIRSQFAIVETIIENLRSTTFNTLDMEVVDSQDASAWKRLFTTMRTHPTIPNTLERLKIDHHIEIDGDIEDTPASTDDKASDMRFTLNTITPLSKFSNLKRFAVDTNLPPDVEDKDLEEVAKWWPGLESLELGVWPEEEGEDAGDWKPRTTLGSLESVARRCSNMHTLVLPVDVDHPFTPSLIISQHKLQKLAICQTEVTISETAASYIHTLFPSLGKAVLF